MTTKEFANLFNMSVDEMCEFTGFSRQGLNEIVKGNSTKNGTKKREAKYDLRELALEMCLHEKLEAEERYKARVKAVSDKFTTI